MASLPEKPGSDAKKKLVDYARENRVPEFDGGSDKRWYRGGVSSTKWNKTFPYQLRIMKLVGGTAGSPHYEVAKVNGKDAVFTLPIPPESISVSTPFAINTSITLGGSIEEHGGAPIRMITLSGSLGVAFGRDAGDATKQLNFFESVFAGTVANFENTRASLNQLNPNVKQAFNVHDQSDFEDDAKLAKLTGYHQARLIQGFLESYAELKNSSAKDARLYRLAFCMWKDEAVYLVSPISFEVHKAANSPLEYLYSLQLKATKRIEFSKGVAELAHDYTPVQRDPSKLAKFLNTIEGVRQVLQGAKKTIQAISGDMNANLVGTLRELTLFAKDELAVPLALADLPDAIVQEAKNAVMVFQAASEDFSTGTSREAAAGDEARRQYAGEATDDPDPTGYRRATHPAFEVFENPSENYDTFSNINVGDLNLAPSTMSKIAEERERVQKTTRLEFEQKRDTVVAAVLEYSRALGVSHPTYERVLGLAPAETQAVDEATLEDYEVLFAMNRLVQELNRLVVTNDNEPQHKLDTLATVAGLAEQSGIAFRIPRSKFAAPFPYGSTLEMLAARYLGDPNRWHEIAVLNGLKAPFVDEEGFYLPLVVNGNQANVIVSDASKLFVGQSVWIGSSGAQRTRRRIRKVERLTPTQYLVTVDGDPDMQRFVTLAEAYLFAFTPATVNSQQLIYIPSEIEPRDGDFQSKGIPGVNEQDAMIAVGGVDLLLTPQNDLVITQDGDAKWSVGLTNIVQKVRLALSVRQGTLNQHPNYGLPLEAGTSIADVEISDVVRSIESMFAGDPSFNGIKAAQVRVNGPLARVGVAIEVRGTDQVIPVSVDIKQ